MVNPDRFVFGRVGKFGDVAERRRSLGNWVVVIVRVGQIDRVIVGIVRH